MKPYRLLMVNALAVLDSCAYKHSNVRSLGFGNWRGEALAHMRNLIHDAIPDLEVTWKRRRAPIFEKNGTITTDEVYNDRVKLTFHKSASLPTRSACPIPASTATPATHFIFRKVRWWMPRRLRRW